VEKFKANLRKYELRLKMKNGQAVTNQSEIFGFNPDSKSAEPSSPNWGDNEFGKLRFEIDDDDVDTFLRAAGLDDDFFQHLTEKTNERRASRRDKILKGLEGAEDNEGRGRPRKQDPQEETTYKKKISKEIETQDKHVVPIDFRVQVCNSFSRMVLISNEEHCLLKIPEKNGSRSTCKCCYHEKNIKDKNVTKKSTFFCKGCQSAMCKMCFKDFKYHFAFFESEYCRSARIRREYEA
jgi:hypothetical protein